MVSFDVSFADELAIRRIAKRATAMYRAAQLPADQISIEMDITATHANGMPLNLQALLVADDVNFAHDIGGIARHLDRQTGKLRDNFRPRFACCERIGRAAA